MQQLGDDGGSGVASWWLNGASVAVAMVNVMRRLGSRGGLAAVVPNTHVHTAPTVMEGGVLGAVTRRRACVQRDVASGECSRQADGCGRRLSYC